MARNSTEKTHKERQRKAEWKGFVNVYLTPEDKKAIKENQLNDGQLFDFIVGVAEMDYKFSVVWSDLGSFFTATLYGAKRGCPNAGYAMSMRHSDLGVCMSGLDYILGEEGLEADWTERFTTVSDNDW